MHRRLLLLLLLLHPHPHSAHHRGSTPHPLGYVLAVLREFLHEGHAQLLRQHLRRWSLAGTTMQLRNWQLSEDFRS